MATAKGSFDMKRHLHPAPRAGPFSMVEIQATAHAAKYARTVATFFTADRIEVG
jgi:hypothetical protein